MRKFVWSSLGSQLNLYIADFFWAEFKNAKKMTSAASVPLEVSYIITIIINSVSCPFTVLLNVLIIKAVMTSPRLRINCNFLLACLAVTDALTGLFGQPSYVLWRILLIFGFSSSETAKHFHANVMHILATASCLHLMLITFERLIAIKFTMQYSNVMTNNNLKIAVSAIWIIGFMNGIFTALRMNLALYYIGSLVTISCVVFVAFAYVILYHETRRHRRKIKTQQLPQEEVERSTKENKALKTTVFVVSAVIVSLLPAGFCFIGLAKDLFETCPINEPLRQTCVMLNSLVNPLIYCSRQKEMRKVVFRKRTQVIYPAMQC